MSRVVLVLISLVTGLLACGKSIAQARGTVSRESRAEVQLQNLADIAAGSRKLQELEAWLGRLVGEFQVKGTAMMALEMSLTARARGARAINGAMECARIGNGPAVQCLIKAYWRSIEGPETRRVPFAEAYNTLNPAVLLFALDPDALRLKVLLVDDHGIADDLSGVLVGDTAELVSGRKGCWGPPASPHCPWALGITAKAGSDTIQVKSSFKSDAVFIEFQLRRKTAVNVGLPSAQK